VIHVEGELDMSSVPTLETSLADAERFHRGRILVDLDGLSFIDSHGLQLLLAASRRSAGTDGRLRMTRGTGEVARMFKLTMLDLTLPLTDAAAMPVPEAVEERVES
jgi:anti-anti-sigma factor